MHLKKLSLINYKNFEAIEFELSQQINCFLGNNGIGKTNVLDAIYYLSFTKSYFNSADSQNIRHGESFFVIEGLFEKNGREEHLFCGVQKGQKKAIKRNAKLLPKLQEHIGEFPLVIISPSDRDLISEGSDVRRKFIDGVISQFDSKYLKTLLNYNKQLSQRNALLKYFAQNRTFDEDSLIVYDEIMSELAQYIYDKRSDFLTDMLPTFLDRYNSISENKELVSIEYKSGLENSSLLDLLRQGRERDRASQYTNIGIHKDDLIFNIGDFPIKKFGSQGQQKTFLISLKLAQFEYLKRLKNNTPILLLDDIFDKLDESRVEQIVRLVNQHYFGQIFISDTHPERTENIIKKINEEYKIFKL
ncbi:MAG: DNA replication/repair protein RecF [Flavobacteriales bacterium]|nr:DNA replication/repair protein RecF [Flavobacteriales bacterium]